jgi:hypothetical protein
MRRGEMRNQRYRVASARGPKPVRTANRSPRSCGSTSISRTSTSPSIIDTTRVWPSPSRTARVAARFLPFGLSVGVATGSASPSQSKDSGTRYGTPSAEALATHVDVAGEPMLGVAPTLSAGARVGPHGSWSSPRTLPAGSVTLATRRPPPTSCAGSFTVAPAAVTSASFASMSCTSQNGTGEV